MASRFATSGNQMATGSEGKLRRLRLSDVQTASKDAVVLLQVIVTETCEVEFAGMLFGRARTVLAAR